MRGVDPSDFCTKELELPPGSSFWMWPIFAKDSKEQLRRLWDLGFSVHWVWKYLRVCIFLSFSIELALASFSPLGCCDILILLLRLWWFFTSYWFTPLTTPIFIIIPMQVFFHGVFSQYSHSSQTPIFFQVCNSLNGISVLSLTRAQNLSHLWLTLLFPPPLPSRDM